MSVDKTLKALGLRKKTPADKVREAGKNLNARFAKLRGATPESRARAWGERYGLDKRPVVLVGTKPSALLGDPRRLAAMGVTGVVNLCAEFRGPETAYRRLAIEHLRLPTSDHVEPAAEVLDAAVAFIRKHERAGGRVYVHCKAGHGRSAAVAYAWLVFADRGATSPRAVYAAFARKRNVRRGLWRQPNVASLTEQLALSDYKTPATRS